MWQALLAEVRLIAPSASRAFILQASPRNPSFPRSIGRTGDCNPTTLWTTRPICLISLIKVRAYRYSVKTELILIAFQAARQYHFGDALVNGVSVASVTACVCGGNCLLKPDWR